MTTDRGWAPEILRLPAASVRVQISHALCRRSLGCMLPGNRCSACRPAAAENDRTKRGRFGSDHHLFRLGPQMRRFDLLDALAVVEKGAVGSGLLGLFERRIQTLHDRRQAVVG